MAITCNFDREDCEGDKQDKVLVRVPSAREAAVDTPVMKPVTHGAYLWDLSPRRRSGKRWRDIASVN